MELSNLHRQVLHGEENQGQAKALSAAKALKRYYSAPAHRAVQFTEVRSSLIPASSHENKIKNINNHDDNWDTLEMFPFWY